MAQTIGSAMKTYVLNALRDGTDGINYVELFDDDSSFISSPESVTWAAVSDGSTAMAESELIFNITAGTTVAGFVIGNFDGGTGYTTFITYTFDQQYTYATAGTFVLNDLVLSM